MGRRETRCGHPEVGVSVGLTGPYGAHIICGSDQRGRRRSGMSERSWLRRRPLLRPRLSLWIEGETTGRTEQSSMIAPLPPQWAGVRESACMPCKLSRFSHVCLFATPWTVTCQTPLSMGFPRQEYWSGLPVISSPGDLPDPGIEPSSLASPTLAGGFFTIEPLGKLCVFMK